jgi:peptidoglycan/xylan/chitin deacetylase (PgdA/CDA1 family)
VIRALRSGLRGAAEKTIWPLTSPIGSLRSVRTDEPHAVITFDDGPEPGNTERVLEALAARGATATFFVLVRRAEQCRSLLGEVRDAGHEIGLHGVDHRRLTTLRPEDVERGLVDGRRRLEDLLGEPVRWFRPPYGAQTPGVWRAVLRRGMVPVVWGPAAWDWLDRPAAELAERAMSGMARGSVLLTHDGFAGKDDGVDDGPPPRLDRGELVRRVLDGMAERGLTACSLSTALQHGRAEYRAWFRR